MRSIALWLALIPVVGMTAPPVDLTVQRQFSDFEAVADRDFAGDRLIIFWDASPAFAAFAQNVLRDREVAAFIGGNFTVYVVEAGGAEARALPQFGGGRPDPRVIAHSPRLDNMSLRFFPTPALRKENMLTALRAMKQAQTVEEFSTAIGRFAGPTADNRDHLGE